MKPPPKKPLRWRVILADLAVVATIVPVVLPHLTTAPEWLRTTLLVFALVVARLTGTGRKVHAPPPAALALLAAFLALPLVGCGATWQTSARVHLGLASRGTVVAEQLAGVEAARACPNADPACLHERGFDLVHDSLASARAAILAGEAAVAREVTQSGWDAVVRCIASAADHLLHALRIAGVGIPDWLEALGASIAALAGPCTEPSWTPVPGPGGSS